MPDLKDTVSNDVRPLTTPCQMTSGQRQHNHQINQPTTGWCQTISGREGSYENNDENEGIENQPRASSYSKQHQMRSSYLLLEAITWSNQQPTTDRYSKVCWNRNCKFRRTTKTDTIPSPSSPCHNLNLRVESQLKQRRNKPILSTSLPIRPHYHCHYFFNPE